MIFLKFVALCLIAAMLTGGSCEGPRGRTGPRGADGLDAKSNFLIVNNIPVSNLYFTEFPGDASLKITTSEPCVFVIIATMTAGSSSSLSTYLDIDNKNNAHVVTDADLSGLQRAENTMQYSQSLMPQDTVLVDVRKQSKTGEVAVYGPGPPTVSTRITIFSVATLE